VYLVVRIIIRRLAFVKATTRQLYVKGSRLKTVQRPSLAVGDRLTAFRWNKATSRPEQNAFFIATATIRQQAAVVCTA